MRGLPIIVAFLCLAAPAAGQWLPPDAQKRERALWAGTAVPFVDGLKFYQLTKVSQRLSTVNSVDVHGIYPSQDEYPWTAPAGLHDSPRDQWRVARGAYIPGPVRVMRRIQGVRNSFGNDQPQPYIDWEFPDGTVFAEILIRKYRGAEWPFELRMREKNFGKWDQGTAYRVTFPRTQRRTWSLSPGKLADFGIGWTPWYEVEELPPRTMNFPSSDFRPSRLALIAQDAHSFVPENYMGSVRACSTCHDLAGSSTTYGGGTISGNDTVLSWSPFTMRTLGTDDPPELDHRWNLEVQ